MFYLSKRSKSKLEGVHPDLVMLAGVTIVSTPIDFGITDGLRTLEEQQKYVAAGVSKTLESKHRRHNEDGTLCAEMEAGYGWALDLVPYVQGRLCWEVGPCIEIAKQVRSAAISLNVRIRWGGVWDQALNDLSPELDKEVEDYAERLGKAPFFDGPHFEKVPS